MTDTDGQTQTDRHSSRLWFVNHPQDKTYMCEDVQPERAAQKIARTVFL